ncbi:MAG: GAF domain-containing protein, partial [Terriglobales bacterium]
MAQPSIFPHASIAPGLSSSPAERERELAGLSPAPDWDRVLTELRTTIANGNFTLDAMLQHIVETAQMVTCANGAAIAIWQEDSVICQARAGNIAPDLGAKLDTDSGVSGQCLRTGGAFCCEDTNHDTRVDAEVCRRLGLRSLAVVPVGRKPAVSGVLEAFSVLPYAFRNAQVKLLEELAELVIVAQCRSAEATAQASSEKPVSATWKSWPELKLIIGAAVMLVVVLTSWLVFRREPGRPDLSMALTQPVTGPAALPPPAASPPVPLTP